MDVIKSLSFLCLLISISQPAYSQPAFAQTELVDAELWITDWEEHDGDEGFETRCRKHESKIKQCVFSTVSSAPLPALANAVRDVNRFTEWAESVRESQRIPELEQDNEIVVYTEYSVSAGYDRFAVTRYETEQYPEEQRVRVRFHTFDAPGLNSDLELVRFPIMKGYWQFQTLENGQTLIEHESFTLPGGAIQRNLAFFYNIAYLDASYETIQNLIHFSQQEPYISSQWQWEEKPVQALPAKMMTSDSENDMQSEPSPELSSELSTSALCDDGTIPCGTDTP